MYVLFCNGIPNLTGLLFYWLVSFAFNLFFSISISYRHSLPSFQWILLSRTASHSTGLTQWQHHRAISHNSK